MNEPLPELALALGLPRKASGGWMAALAHSLEADASIQLGVASRVSGTSPQHILLGGVHHFTVPAPTGYGFLRPDEAVMNRYREIIASFQPDVIHVHGTEWYGGLVTAKLQCCIPTVVSIQGLIDHHIRHLTGHLEALEILKSRTLRTWTRFDGLWEQKAQWRKRATVEREIIDGHTLFIGRTLWDRAHLRRLNPDAVYYHCHEMVRSEFYDQKWSLSGVRRHTIFAPSAAYPLKGFHVLVKAIAILKREFPDVQVRVPLAHFPVRSGMRGLYSRLVSGDYQNYLNGLIDRLGVGMHITGLGTLSGQEMADEMRSAHVFTLNSFVENSPNTMAEAFTVGLPAVVSLAGGVPSLIQDGVDALGFPAGDEAVLAEQIGRIFKDDELALHLSENGKRTAARHSHASILANMKEIYSLITS
jgi:glycosyltransferase involved in cell wall biosynthesis